MTVVTVRPYVDWVIVVQQMVMMQRIVVRVVMSVQNIQQL